MPGWGKGEPFHSALQATRKFFDDSPIVLREKGSNRTALSFGIDSFSRRVAACQEDWGRHGSYFVSNPTWNRCATIDQSPHIPYNLVITHRSTGLRWDGTAHEETLNRSP